MDRILKGSILWADLNPTIGHEQSVLRPVLVISDTYFNENSGTVVVLAITSKPPKAGYPLTKQIHTVKLPKTSWVKISQIRTLSVKRIRGFTGVVDEQELNEIIQALFLFLKH
ncbi:MAG: type II toxin-antitoxin system PemK/MazF family toxin [Thermotogota bacterium]|nr:type II toxin-antitoxin system PemK/MazF family toxin [Thermotogota bacterium]